MKKKINKQRMALLMKTSRAQVDRLLDPDNDSATIESLTTRRQDRGARVAVPLTGDRQGFWRYRVGDYRIVAAIEDDRFVVLVVTVGHRREVYH